MKARQSHARKHPRKDRKFIPRRMMSTIRWDVSVANRSLKEAQKQDEEYVSLHAWGCGCCFLRWVPRVQSPAPTPSSPSPEFRVAPGGGTIKGAS